MDCNFSKTKSYAQFKQYTIDIVKNEQSNINLSRIHNLIHEMFHGLSLKDCVKEWIRDFLKQENITANETFDPNIRIRGPATYFVISDATGVQKMLTIASGSPYVTVAEYVQI